MAEGISFERYFMKTWPEKCLRHSQGLLARVVLSIIAHRWDAEGAQFFMWQVYRKTMIRAPFVCSAAKVMKTGHVCADVLLADGDIRPMRILFRNLRHMESVFRKLADAARLDDDERRQLFDAVKGPVRPWVVCDYRIDPAMDPADPESRRLAVQ